MGRAGGATSGIWRGTAEGGFIFMEVLIALPLLVMLLMGMMMGVSAVNARDEYDDLMQASGGREVDPE